MQDANKDNAIILKVELDADKMPENIRWSSPGTETQDAKAMLISLFDRENRDTLKIDLWTKDMQVMEMDRFFFQTMRAMADTYFRATQNKELAEQMQQFVRYFGEKTEILPPAQKPDGQ